MGTELKLMYVVYETESAGIPPCRGVFASRKEAEKAVDVLVELAVAEILAAPAEETGLTENDREWLIEDTRKTFGIQAVYEGMNYIIEESSCV